MNSELAWQRRIAHFFHQSILWIMTACMHGSAGYTLLAPEHSVDQAASLHGSAGIAPLFHQSILWIMTAACMHDAAQDSTPLPPEHSVNLTTASLHAQGMLTFLTRAFCDHGNELAWQRG
jgi:hypothetical protein